MKIYVSHLRAFDYKKKLYSPLRDSVLSEKHTFIFPHEESDAPFDTEQLMKMQNCDLVLAEVSSPSTGQGMELAWASIYKIPVVCIFEEGATISRSLHKVTTHFISYTSLTQAIPQIEKAVNSYAKITN